MEIAQLGEHRKPWPVGGVVAVLSLDRDAYLDAATSLGHGPELPAAYTEAVDRARDVSTDRIRYDGYPGSFSYGNGPHWVDLFVQFPHAEATVEALRLARLDRDYSTRTSSATSPP